jgi:CelD/BcsL family acetyltransferase involved in cellulose biosynthesis
MIEIIDDLAGFARLRAEWTELLRASDADCLFLTWEWLYTWWYHLAGRRRLHIVVLRSGGDLLAIAPVAVRDHRVASLLPLPTLQFLGTGAVGSDYLDVIVRRGAEEEATRALAAHLADQRVVLEMAQVKTGGSIADALASTLTVRGWRQCRLTTERCPFISLAGHSWESFLGTLGADHRYNFRRRLRNATRAFDVRFERVRAASERPGAFEQLIALHQMRWRDGGSDGFHLPALVNFHDEFTALAFERDWLRLFVLSFDGRPVAALYGVRYGRVFYFYQSGYDPEYRTHSVGLLAMGLAIKSAIEEGAEEYDLLHGSESYKFHWARQVRELQRLELYPPCARALVLQQIRSVSTTAKGHLRRMLPKTIVDRISAARRVGVWRGLYGTQVQ